MAQKKTAKAAPKKTVAKKVTAKKAAPKRAVQKKPVKSPIAAKPGIVGIIHGVGDPCETCTWGFDSTAIDTSRAFPRKVIATVTRTPGHSGTFPDGTPFLTFTLSELPAKRKKGRKR